MGDVHAGQDRAGEDRGADARVLEIRAFQDRPGEVHALQPRMTEGSAFERGVGEIDAVGLFRLADRAGALVGHGGGPQIGAVEPGIGETSAADGGAAHIGLHQPRRGQVAIAQIGAFEIGALQIDRRHCRSHQRGERQVGLGQVAVGEIEAHEPRAGKLRARGAALVGEQLLMPEHGRVQLLLRQDLARFAVIVLEHGAFRLPAACAETLPKVLRMRVKERIGELVKRAPETTYPQDRAQGSNPPPISTRALDRPGARTPHGAKQC